MELKIRDGEYVTDGIGGLVRVSGTEALLQRVLFRLQARRGMFPFLETIGSRLWKLGGVAAAQRQAAAKQYVAEALEDEENLSVEAVTLQNREDGTTELTVKLEYEGETLSAELTVR